MNFMGFMRFMRLGACGFHEFHAFHASGGGCFMKSYPGDIKKSPEAGADTENSLSSQNVRDVEYS